MILPFVFGVALAGGSYYYQRKQAKKAQRQAEREARQRAQENFSRSMQVQIEDAPRIMTFGTVNKIGGNLIWLHKSPWEQGVEYHLVVALCVNRLNAVEFIYVDDTPWLRRTNSFASSYRHSFEKILPEDLEGDLQDIAGLANADGIFGTLGKSVVEDLQKKNIGRWFHAYAVNSTSFSKPDLSVGSSTNPSANYPDPQFWTADHWRAKDFAFACITMTANPEVFGGPPNLSFIVRPEPHAGKYNAPHEALNNLGNPVSALYEYIVSPHGFNSQAYVDRNLWSRQAEKLVNPDGSLKVETCYLADLTKEHSVHFDKLLEACNGQLSIENGEFKIHVGERDDPVLTLGEDDFVGKFNVKPQLPERDDFNVVQATWTNKENLFTKETYLHKRDDVDSGATVPRQKNIDLTQLCTKGSVANICSQLVRQNLNQIHLTVDVSLNALETDPHPGAFDVLFPGDLVRVNNHEYGFVEKLFECEQIKVGPSSDGQGLIATLSLHEYDSDVFMDADAQDSLADAVESNLPSKTFVPAPENIEASEELYRIGDVISNRVTLTWDAEDFFVTGFEVQAKQWFENDFQTKVSSSTSKSVSFDLEAGTYDFRVRSKNSFFYTSEWVEINNIQIVGKTAPPEPPSNPKVTFTMDSVHIEFDPAQEIDAKDLQVRWALCFGEYPNTSLSERSGSFSVDGNAFNFSLKVDFNVAGGAPDFYRWIFLVQRRDTSNNFSATQTVVVERSVPVPPETVSVIPLRSSFHADWEDAQDFEILSQSTLEGVFTNDAGFADDIQKLQSNGLQWGPFFSHWVLSNYQDFVDSIVAVRVALDVQKYIVRLLRHDGNRFLQVKSRLVDTTFFREENITPGQYRLEARSRDNAGGVDIGEVATREFTIAEAPESLQQISSDAKPIFGLERISLLQWRQDLGISNAMQTAGPGKPQRYIGSQNSSGFSETSVYSSLFGFATTIKRIYPCLNLSSTSFQSQIETFRAITGREPQNFADMGTTFVDPLNQNIQSKASVWFEIENRDRSVTIRADLTPDWKLKLGNLNYSFRIRVFSEESFDSLVAVSSGAELSASNVRFIEIELVLDAVGVLDSGNVYLNSTDRTDAIAVEVFRSVIEEESTADVFAADAGGTAIDLANDFLTILSATGTPRGSSSINLSLDWDAGADTLTVFAFDENGARTDATITYRVRGY